MDGTGNYKYCKWETSELSYTKRYWPASNRKQAWLNQTRIRHIKGLGKTAKELVAEAKSRK
jgi:hypothetical protein